MNNRSVIDDPETVLTVVFATQWQCFAKVQQNSSSAVKNLYAISIVFLSFSQVLLNFVSSHGVIGCSRLVNLSKSHPRCIRPRHMSTKCTHSTRRAYLAKFNQHRASTGKFRSAYYFSKNIRIMLEGSQTNWREFDICRLWYRWWNGSQGSPESWANIV